MRSAAYAPILSNDPDETSSPKSEAGSLRREEVGVSEPLHPLAMWAFILCISVCVVNVAMLLHAAMAPESVLDVDTLRRPSSYIDLDTIPWSEERLAALPPIVNVPIIIAPVSRTEPHRIWPDDARAWMTHDGMVTPDQREVLITEDVSLILQFRVLDHKMERCSVVAELPSEADIRQRSRDNHVDLNGDTTVHVYRLSSARTLRRREISYANKPPRADHLGDFTVTLGALNGTIEFDCPERSLQTFEIACPGARCRINFWQDRDKPIMAFYLRQTHSLHNAS